MNIRVFTSYLHGITKYFLSNQHLLAILACACMYHIAQNGDGVNPEQFTKVLHTQIYIIKPQVD